MARHGCDLAKARAQTHGMTPPGRITFFVVSRFAHEMVCDCEGAEAVLIQIEPSGVPLRGHSCQDSTHPLEISDVTLTLKGLNRSALVRINTAYDKKPFYEGKGFQGGSDSISGH